MDFENYIPRKKATPALLTVLDQMLSQDQRRAGIVAVETREVSEAVNHTTGQRRRMKVSLARV